MEKIDSVIVLNAGSSSLKFKIFYKEKLTEVASGQITGIGTDKVKLKIKNDKDETLKDELLDSKLSRDEIVISLLNLLAESFPSVNITVAGHRVVHGGVKYIQPTIVTQEVIDNLKDIIHLTPIHLPHNIRPMEVLKEKFPSLLQVACFDTAFHSTNPDFTRYYALPKKLIEEDKVLRYGFHGLSYEYISLYLKENHPELYKGKTIVCHLGAGASLAALKEGKSYTTTMGFTPLDGVVMGTRTGQIDPGILLFLLTHKKYTPKEIEDLLYYQSGILGLSGESSDFYTVEQSSSEDCKTAWKVFYTSVIKQIGALTAMLDGVDAIVFTAGVGENSATLRRDVSTRLNYLGVELNDAANKAGEVLISKPSSKVKLLAVPTQEELMIARQAVSLS